MAADEERVQTRVTEILNACDPGTYSASVSARNKTRNSIAIRDFCAEGGLMILKAIAERPNEYRYPFLFDTPPITVSGLQVPPHIGPPAAIHITEFPGADPVEGRRSKYDKIQSYRENPFNVYEDAAHDEEASTNSGLYDIWDDRFFFTGFSAILTLARLPVRADNTTLIPEIFENTWIRLGVGESSKLGLSAYATPIIAEYASRGSRDVEEFKAGGRVFTEVDDPGQTTADHNLVR